MSEKKATGKTVKNKNIISEESAEEQLELLKDFYDIDPDCFVSEKKEAIEAALSKITSSIRKGKVEITHEEEGVSVKQLLTYPAGETTSLIYSPVTGLDKMELDKQKDGANYARMYSLLGKMSKVGKDGIASLKGSDVSTAECLGAIFL